MISRIDGDNVPYIPTPPQAAASDGATVGTYGIFYDSNNSSNIDDDYKLESVSYSQNNSIKVEFWKSSNGNTKYIMYCNDVPVQVERFENDKHYRNSLIKEDFLNFIINNLNKDNVNDFLCEYGKNEFIKDVFYDKNIDKKTKNLIYSYVVNIASSQNKEILADAKKRLVMDGDFEGSFEQGNAGDCVILGRLAAMMFKPAGKNLLKSHVRVDDNGNMIINFAGLNKEVTVTYEDLTDKDYKNFSTNNADILAMEIAWQKLTKFFGGVNNPLLNRGFEYALLGNGMSVEISNLEYLVPFPNLIKSTLLKDYYKDEFNAPNKVYVFGPNITNFIFRLGIDLIDENTGRITKIQPAHQYGIAKADDDYIYLINPNDTSRNYKLKWADFNRLSGSLHAINFEKKEMNVPGIITEQFFLD